MREMRKLDSGLFDQYEKLLDTIMLNVIMSDVCEIYYIIIFLFSEKKILKNDSVL